MNNSTYLKEIKVNDHESYFVLTSITDQTFNFIVCKGLLVYRGKLNTGEIEEQSSQLSIDGNNVRDIILQFLMQKDATDMLTEFVKLSDSDGCLVMKFKKILDRQMNIRAQLCSVELYQSAEVAEDLGKILHFSVDQLDRKTDTLARAESELKQTQGELQSSLDKLAALVAEKAEIEQKLFSNFALVLNEKKRKIDALQDELSTIQAQIGTVASEDHAHNDSHSDHD